MLLTIIIVNYNTSKYTLEALKSVYEEQMSNDFEVIVLDNGSTDNSVKDIRTSAFSDKIKFIVSKANTGFAVGNNIAAEQAKGKYLLLLNPDTIVLDHAIDKLLSFAQNCPSAKIWGGRTLFADGRLNPSSCWQHQTIWGLVCQLTGFSSLFRNSNFFNPEGYGGWNREGDREVDIVTGCFFLINRSFWVKLSGFNPAFFMYGEEADLCLRAKKQGARPIVTSDATIIHHGGSSEKIRSDKIVKLLTAKIRLIRYHFTPSTRSIGVMLLAGWPFSRYIFHKLLILIGQTSSAYSKDVWQDVWKRRNEWLNEQQRDCQ